MIGAKQLLKRQMREYLQTILEVTPEELAELKAWVASGNSPYSNPYFIADEQGRELPYIHALRMEQELNDSFGSDLF